MASDPNNTPQTASRDPEAKVVPVNIGNIVWQFARFDALSQRQLQQIWAARQIVFGIEQDCVYLDIDGADEYCWHLVAWPAVSGGWEASGIHAGLPLAYARLVDPGVKYAEPSMGRVITMESVRGIGLGRELVRRAIAHARQVYPGQAIRISAQSRLERFYAEFGFAIQGESYLEDGIAHTEMLLAPAYNGGLLKK